MKLLTAELEKIKGLSEKEASLRLKRDGYNELPSSKRRSVLKIIFEVFKEPMFLLLVACGTIYLVLGDVAEAIMLLGFVFVIMGITIYQEGKTEKAITALRDLSSPRALVIREGLQKRISGKEVARGDIILLNEGDRVPADAKLLWGINMSADESLLTGESVPVRKEESDLLYSGSLIVHGQGMAEVVSIGLDTEMGKIGKIISSLKGEKTPLQIETARLVKIVFIIASFLSILVIASYGLLRGDWLNGILSGITLAMAMLPEEFPVVLTIFLALGAWRIARKNVLTRKVSTVETLGAATVLCVDKTGTLTQNKMAIKKIYSGGDYYDVGRGSRTRQLPEKFHELIEYGILASKKDPFDPMEQALKELGHERLYDTEHIHTDWPLVEEYPISKEVTALSHVWETPDGTGYVVSAKGAPEAILDLCHTNQVDREALFKDVYAMAAEGLRVLGVAKAFFERGKLPQSQHDFEFKFVGLIGLADPIRDTVPAAIKECYSAGIRVVMITGDYPVTAQNIARLIGLKDPDKVLTGPEVSKMSTRELRERAAGVNIFSRVTPEQKLLIVNALKANGEIVAMTGDGVNDAPALKASHIGIAMGQRGTDVARESSGLVILDDDFSSIVEAVKSGRRIFDNLKKAMAYIIGVHIPIAGASLVPVMLGWPLILYPAHIVFLELIIDPACSIVFESEPAEENIMKRRPRDPKESLFSRKLLVLSFMQGFFAAIVVIAVFKIALITGQTEAESRTLAFLTLLVSNICLILTNRSWSKSMVSYFSVPNRALAAVLAGAAIFSILVLYMPFFRMVFHFGPMHPADILICLGAGAWSVAWFELLKFIFNKMNKELI